MFARILQPTRSTTQSGPRKSDWLLSFIPNAKSLSIDKVIGWTSSNDTMPEVVLHFPTKEAAEEYAKTHAIPYEIILPKKAKLIRKSYADNFK